MGPDTDPNDEQDDGGGAPSGPRSGSEADAPHPGSSTDPDASSVPASSSDPELVARSSDVEERPRRSIGLLALVFSLAAGLLVLAAWTRASLFDFRQMEPEAFDYAWILQYPWRAARGEWCGRDFFYPRGPLWQLISWTASGFRFRSVQWTVGANEIAFGLLALATVPILVTRTLRQRGPRLGAAAALSLLVLYQPLVAFRTMFVTLLVLHLYALRPPAQGSEPTPKQGALAAVVTAVTFLLAYERGVIAVVSVGAMAIYGVLSQLARRAPVKPELRRFGGFVASLIAMQILLVALGWALGASYLTYLDEMRSIAGAYTVAMQGYGSRAGVLVLVSASLLLLLVLTLGRHRDTGAGTLLAGALPSTVAALVRTDPIHIVMGTGVIAGALVLIAFRNVEGRRRLGWAVGAMGAGVLAFWAITYPRPLEEWSVIPRHFVAAWSGPARSQERYHGDLPRTLAWARSRHAAAPMRCVGLEESLGLVRPLAGVAGPLQLRWTTDLQDRVADTLERQRCPYYVHRFFTFDHGELIGNWIFGEDFLAVARTYRPVRMIGPSVVAMELREQPRFERELPVPFAGQGEWTTLEVPGSVTLSFERPVEESSLLAVDYYVEVPDTARYLGGVPNLEFHVGRTGSPGTRQLAVLGHVNRDVRQILPVDPWTAEWRWMAGYEPRVARHADRLVFGLRRIGRATPDRVRVQIRAITELRPGGDARRPTWGASPPADLVAELRAGRAHGRFVTIGMGDPVTIRPHPDVRFDASLYFPVRPGLGSGLRGAAVLASNEGDGADLQVWIVDPLDADNRRVHVTTVPLEPDVESPTGLDIPLDAWLDREVFVRLVVRPRGDDVGDLVEIPYLELTEAPHARLLSAALRRGEARASHAEPRILGPGDIFLHPNGPHEAPAELVIGVEPSAESCFATGLRNGGAGGDGVWMEVEVRARDESVLLFREHLAPGVERRVPRHSLGRWAGSAVELVLRSRPGIDTSFDWATFVTPQLELGCGDAQPPPIGEAVGRPVFGDGLEGARVVAGEPRLSHGELFLHPLAPGAHPPASVGFPLEPQPGECLELWLRHGAAAGQGDGVRLSGSLRASEAAEPARALFDEHLHPGTSRRVSVPLGEWAGRRTWLTLTSLPGETTSYDWAFFIAPTVTRCGAGSPPDSEAR